MILGSVRSIEIVHLIQHFLNPRVRMVILFILRSAYRYALSAFIKTASAAKVPSLASAGRDHSVNRCGRALHFASEIAVAGRIDNVDLLTSRDNARRWLWRMVFRARAQIVAGHHPLGALPHSFRKMPL